MTNNDNSTQTATFAYIEHMLIELRQMSEKQDAPVLAYLIEMAIIEAKDMGDVKYNAATPTTEHVDDIKHLLSS